MVGVTPGVGGNAETNGLARIGLQNVTDETLTTRLDLLGYHREDTESAFGISLGAQKYLDLGADPTGATNSYAAMRQWNFDCNVRRVPGILPQGLWWYDGPESMLWLPGTGIIGIPTGAKVDFDHDYAEVIAGRASCIVIRYSANRNVVPIALHAQSIIKDLVVWYPDHVARLLSESNSIDATSYPVIIGAPDEYAPTICTDHAHDHDGNVLESGGSQAGGIEIYDLTLLGSYTGMYFGDADVADEPWAANFASGTGKGVPGIILENIGGFCLYRGIVVERANNSVNCKNWQFVESKWTEASQMGVVATSEWPDTNPKPLIMWAQANLTLITLRRKCFMTQENLSARVGRRILHCEAGDALDGEPAGPDGQDSGKFRVQFRGLRIERFPTLVRLAETAYMHRPVFSGTGHFMDHFDPDCVEPVFDIQTHKDRAGSIDKQSGTFKPQGNYSGWRFYARELEVTESSGPVFRNTANDGCNYYRFVELSMARWGQGDKDSISAIENLSTISQIDHVGGTVAKSSGGSGRVYDVVDASIGAGQKLRPINVIYVGMNDTNIVVGYPGWLGYSSCYHDPDASDTADDADDEDGGSGGEQADPDEEDGA